MSMKIALIGYGGMGGWHAGTISEMDELELTGIWDIRPERLEAAREAGFKTYSSLDELLNDKEPELVTIAVPNNFHKPLSIACLTAGKNVVCEKPVMMNRDELVEVIAVANTFKKVFTVHQNRRWDKDFLIIKKIIDTNVLGAPFVLESRVLGSRRVLCGWRGYKQDGGGMILDWGVHLFDQILYMIDSPVTEVCCHTFSLMENCEADDNFVAMLRFENGLSALVEVSTDCFIVKPRWHVSCLDGTAVIDDWALNGKMIRLSNEDEMAWDESIVYTEAGPTRTMAPRPKETTEELPLPNVESDIHEYYRGVIKAIREGCEPPVKHSEMLRVMKLVDTCFQSAQNGQSIKTII